MMILTIYQLKAQISYEINYSPNNGLPSNDIYGLAQDSLGRIWFATDNGISSFDGYAFQTIPPLPGIAYNSFVRLFHGANGKIWFLSYQGKLAYLNNNSIIPYKWNNIISEKGILQVMSTIWVDSTDRVYFRSKEPGRIVEIAPDGHTTTFDNPSYPLSLYTLFFYNYFDDGHSSTSYPAFNPHSIPDLTDSQHNVPKTILPNPTGTPLKIYKTGNRYLRLTSNNSLTDINPNPKNFDNIFIDSCNIYSEPNGNIWVRKESGGVLLFRKNNLERSVNILKETRVTRILKDREGNYWIATEGNGVYMLPESGLRIYGYDIGLNNLNIIDLALLNNEIYFSTGDNRLFKGKISDDRLMNIKELIINENDKFGRDILPDSNGQLWIVHSKYLRYTGDGVPKPPSIIPLVKLNRIIQTQNKEFILATNQGFFIYKDDMLSYDSRSGQFNRHIQAVHEDENGHLWLGTMDGLFEFYNGKYLNWSDKDSILANPVTTITSEKNHIFIGLRSGKVIIINGAVARTIDRRDGLDCDQVLSMTFDDQSNLWLSTNQGMYRITFQDHVFRKISISRFTIWNGLPSNNIYSICFSGRRIWAATSEGLVTFAPADLERKIPEPKLFIEGVSTDDSTMITGNNIILTPSKRTLTIKYKGVSFHDPGNITYRYRLTDADTGWITTKNTSLRFSNLLPGKYRFELQCRNACGDFTDHIVTTTFLIPKFFYETVVFQLILTVIVLCIIVLSVFFLMKNRQRKADMKNRLLNSEFKALRLQMNPHFIFNILNSINHYITENNPESASQYLKSFARLMRKVLENSRQNTVSLEEETNTMTEYLSLEQMRFENRFDYKIEMDPLIQPMEVFIPPMLIQPFLENAIWHGLLHKESKGNLSIGFHLQNEKNLIVTIEDNGIGRAKSMEISSQKKGRRSAGIELITERINLINQINKTNITLNIMDLFDNDGNASGTKVEFRFPSIL